MHLYHCRVGGVPAGLRARDGGRPHDGWTCKRWVFERWNFSLLHGSPRFWGQGIQWKGFLGAKMHPCMTNGAPGWFCKNYNLGVESREICACQRREKLHLGRAHMEVLSPWGKCCSQHRVRRSLNTDRKGHKKNNTIQTCRFPCLWGQCLFGCAWCRDWTHNGFACKTGVYLMIFLWFPPHYCGQGIQWPSGLKCKSVTTVTWVRFSLLD